MILKIDKDSCFIIERKPGESAKVLISIKTKQDSRTHTIITAELDENMLNDLIAKLISIKTG